MSATAGSGVGDADGICIPGIIWCDGVGDGDAAGICIPGIMSCRGVGDGEGLAVAGRRVPARVRRLGVGLGLGLVAAGLLGLTCPSC